MKKLLNKNALDNKILGLIVEGIVTVYVKEIKEVNYENETKKVMNMQLRWGSSYGWIKTDLPKNIRRLNKYEVNDVLMIKASLTNEFNRFKKNNLLLIRNLVKVRKIGVLDEQFHKKNDWQKYKNSASI